MLDVHDASGRTVPPRNVLTATWPISSKNSGSPGSVCRCCSGSCCHCLSQSVSPASTARSGRCTSPVCCCPPCPPLCSRRRCLPPPSVPPAPEGATAPRRQRPCPAWPRYGRLRRLHRVSLVVSVVHHGALVPVLAGFTVATFAGLWFAPFPWPSAGTGDKSLRSVCLGLRSVVSPSHDPGLAGRAGCR